MEEHPRQSEQEQWVKYGKMMILLDLLQTVRVDWNGSGTKGWAERKLKELEENDDES